MTNREHFAGCPSCLARLWNEQLMAAEALRSSGLVHRVEVEPDADGLPMFVVVPVAVVHWIEGTLSLAVSEEEEPSK